MASGRGDSLYMSSNQQPARRTRSSAPSRLLLRSAISTLHIPPSPPRPGGSLLPYPAVFLERSALFAPICPVLACESLPSLPCAISSQIPPSCSGTSPRQRPLDNAYPPSHPSRTTTRPNRLPYSSSRCLTISFFPPSDRRRESSPALLPFKQPSPTSPSPPPPPLSPPQPSITNEQTPAPAHLSARPPAATRSARNTRRPVEFSAVVVSCQTCASTTNQCNTGAHSN